SSVTPKPLNLLPVRVPTKLAAKLTVTFGGGLVAKTSAAGVPWLITSRSFSVLLVAPATRWMSAASLISFQRIKLTAITNLRSDNMHVPTQMETPRHPQTPVGQIGHCR